MTATEKPFLPTPETLNDLRADWQNSYFSKDGEIFQWPHGAGYWLYGVEFDAELGWLAMDSGEDESIYPNEIDHAAAIETWRAWRRVSRNETDIIKFDDGTFHYFGLDTHFVRKAFDIGCRRFGEWFADDTDALAADLIAQIALFGEEKYA